jgi:glycosyltransferase involved in cell wall biosynthesis
MKKKTPKITVIMPVYNGSRYIQRAIESILLQSFQDFEFIIIDDGSIDESVAIVKEYDDSRIHLIQNKSNLGISHSLNIGIQHSSSELIARMDCDDISMPERLQLQWQYMNQHQQIAICGTRTKIIDDNGNILAIKNSKLCDQTIKVALFYGETSIAHPTVIMRRQFLKRYNLKYNLQYQYAEDYDLWCRCSFLTKLNNLAEPLVYYRDHYKSVSYIYNNLQRKTARAILKQYLIALGVPFTDQELQCHFQFSLPMNEYIDSDYLCQIGEWKEQLIIKNQIHKWFLCEIFEAEMNAKYEKLLSKIITP